LDPNGTLTFTVTRNMMVRRDEHAAEARWPQSCYLSIYHILLRGCWDHACMDAWCIIKPLELQVRIVCTYRCSLRWDGNLFKFTHRVRRCHTL